MSSAPHPCGYECKPERNKPEHDRKRRRSCGRIPPQQPAHEEKHCCHDIDQSMPETNTFRTGTILQAQSVSQPKYGCNQSTNTPAAINPKKSVATKLLLVIK